MPTDHPNSEFMRAAIDASRVACEQGNFPYGAVLVHNSRILFTAHNTVCADGDTSAHAEMNLLRQAARHVDARTLAESVLYTSTECCAMCAGACYWAGVSTVVFGCSTERDGAISREPFAVPMRTLFAEVQRPILLIGPFMEEEATAVLQPFWERVLNA